VSMLPVAEAANYPSLHPAAASTGDGRDNPLVAAQ
jgi:hypothetical protein